MLEYEKVQVKEILTNLRFLSNELLNEEDSVIEAYLCKQALFLSFELSNELLHLNRDIEEKQAKQAEDDIKKRREERAKRRAKRKSQAQAPATEPVQEEEIASPAQTQAQRSKADD